MVAKRLLAAIIFIIITIFVVKVSEIKYNFKINNEIKKIESAWVKVHV